MNSRERILIALNHREPDRVPIDLGGMLASSIHKDAHQELKKYFGLEGGEVEIVNQLEQIVRPDPRIRERFGIDTYGFFPNLPEAWDYRLNPNDNTYYDEWGIKYKMAHREGGYFNEIIEHPLQGISLEALKRYPFPDPKDPRRFKGLKDKIENVFNSPSSLALLMTGCFTGGISQHCAFLTGFEDHYVNMIANERFMQGLIDRVLQFHLDFWNVAMKEFGNFIQVVVLADDLGTQTGPQISLDLYRKYFKPAHKALVSTIKKLVDVKILLHSDGSIYQFIPDFIDIGIDALNPVQVSAKDMEPKKLKREFGRDITFWGGGCDTQTILPYRTPEEVEKEVAKRIEELSPGGGFVFASVHNITPEVPIQNIVALLEAALKYGRK